MHLRDARRGDARDVRPVRRGRQPRRVRALLLPEDYAAGRQEEIYRGLFARVAGVLPDRRALYLQTMVFGRNMIPLERGRIGAPRDSDAWYVALMGRQFPGSWLPLGEEQIVRCAEPHFRAGLERQRAAGLHRDDPPVGPAHRPASLHKSLLKLQLVPRWLTSADFRLAFTSGVSANKVCFERVLIDHYRLVFEKAS